MNSLVLKYWNLYISLPSYLVSSTPQQLGESNRPTLETESRLRNTALKGDCPTDHEDLMGIECWHCGGASLMLLGQG